MRKLGGTTFCYNAIEQDYCLVESVNNLKEFCDEVIVLDAGSTDGTSELVKSLQDKKTKAILCDNEEWKSQKGKEKLAYFTNKAIEQLTTEWNYYQQADEITHENCFSKIREAINGFVQPQAYLISRINLWSSPYMQLNVPQNRKPCSTEIVRLAQSQYRAYGDAESLDALADNSFQDHIRMYHMGFVRDRRKHVDKIRHMQGEVFECGVDQKLEGMEVFDPFKWFAPSDLVPIMESLPLVIQKWAEKRK